MHIFPHVSAGWVGAHEVQGHGLLSGSATGGEVHCVVAVTQRAFFQCGTGMWKRRVLGQVADCVWWGHRVISCCLLYTSDAADEEDSVDLGGRRIIKKKKKKKNK
eukprot:TRINITY_DN13526_c0_g1_i1.p1 TRINITY_DN13526_c0_g1~~TRINITY_DN13526_c0_g1_i1.p1  ORF type:complete len:105 (-),score=18.65 TRINITY_DN13526_c0_g1_i1:83-397(-)